MNQNSYLNRIATARSARPATTSQDALDRPRHRGSFHRWPNHASLERRVWRRHPKVNNISPTSRYAPTCHKRLNLTSASLQSRWWATFNVRPKNELYPQSSLSSRSGSRGAQPRGRAEGARTCGPAEQELQWTSLIIWRDLQGGNSGDCGRSWDRNVPTPPMKKAPRLHERLLKMRQAK